jgi:hypothetical protein
MGGHGGIASNASERLADNGIVLLAELLALDSLADRIVGNPMARRRHAASSTIRTPNSPLDLVREAKR